MTDRSIRRLAYRAWASSFGPDGRVVEFTPESENPRPAFTGVRTWQNDRSTEEVALGVALLPDSTIGRQWNTYVPVIQRPRRSRSGGPARGVIALDPATGRAVALLELDRKQAVWTSVIGATPDGWLLVQSSFGPGGGIAAWDPVSGRLRGLIAFDDVATNATIASQVLWTSAPRAAGDDRGAVKPRR